MDVEVIRAACSRVRARLVDQLARHWQGYPGHVDVQTVFAEDEWLFNAGLLRRLLRDGLESGQEIPLRLRAGLISLATFHGSAAVREQLLQAEREATVEVGGRALDYRGLMAAEWVEQDAERRRELVETRWRLVGEEFGELRQEIWRLDARTTRDLGVDSVVGLHSQLLGIDLMSLGVRCEGFLDDTQPEYERLLESTLVEVGVTSEEATFEDLVSIGYGSRWAGSYAGEQLVDRLRDTLRETGLALEDRVGIHVDATFRPRKHPRGATFGVLPPDDVRLSICPFDGLAAYRAAFIEAGRALHHTLADPGLPPEDRFWGDDTICFVLGTVLGEIPLSDSWYRRFVGGEPPQDFLRVRSFLSLLRLRFLVAKLRYELLLGHSGPAGTAPELYSGLMRLGTLSRHAGAAYLEDAGEFETATRLRAVIVATHLRSFLEREFGDAWWSKSASGELLGGIARAGLGRGLAGLRETIGRDPLGSPETFGREFIASLRH